MLKIRSALAMMLVLGGVSVALAQDPVGSEFQINAYTVGDQAYPSLCSTKKGASVVVWESMQDGDGRGIVGQRYDNLGVPAGTAFLVNSYTPGNQQLPDVACDASGGFVVVWESEGQDDGGYGYGVFGQRFSSDGERVGSEFQVNTYTTDLQQSASVCSADDGNFIVAWHGYGEDGDLFGVFGQRFASDGNAAGTEFQINSYTPGIQSYPQAACDTQGDFVVVWQGDLQDGDGYGIFGQRFVSTGNADGTEFQVNQQTVYSQLLPAVGSSPDGDFVVAWSSYNYADGYGYNYSILARRYGSNGTALSDEIQVNTYTQTSQEAPALYVNSAGDFTVIWSAGDDGDGYGIFGQRFVSTGDRLGSEFQVNTFTLGYQGALSPVGHVLDVGGNQRGDFLVAWQSTDLFDTPPDGDGFGVFGRRYEICAGDCNRDGIVGVDDLIRGINVALGTTPVSACLAFDLNLDNSVGIDEVVTGVNSALNGCGS
jgi:large repetitive protein